MLRRLVLVLLAALGLATALLVGGAVGGVTSVLLVSASSSGVEANGASFAPIVSGNGRYVTFASSATNLAGVDPTPSVTDVFVRDLQTGTTERITAGNGTSQTPSISSDGRWVAFESGATNLVPGDTNGCFDIFLYDRDTDTTIAVTHGNGNSGSAALSGDGSAIAFGSFASDLVSGDTVTGDVFVWDRVGGTTTKVSVSSGGATGDDLSSIPSISLDGDVVVFNSRASNLIAGDTNGSWDVFVRDLSAGTTEAASVSTAGALAESTFFGSGGAQVSPNGEYVAFNSSATNLVPGTTGTQIFLRDLVAETTTHVSTGNGASGGSGTPVVTDGGRVFFTSFAALVADDTNFRADVYLSDPTTRISVTDTLGQGTSSSSSDGASRPSVSGDGTVVVLQNSFPNVIAGTSTRPNIVAYTLGSVGGGTTTATTTATTTSGPPAVVSGGAPRLLLDVTTASPGDPAGFRHGESLDIYATITNRGDGPAHHVVLNLEASYGILDELDGFGRETGITQSGCVSFDLFRSPFDASPVGNCVVAAVLGPGESRRVTLTPTAGRNIAFVFGTMVARSAEIESDVERVKFSFGPAEQERCEATQPCPTSDGEDNRACIDTRCFFEEGNDRGVCAGEEAVCGGGRGEDDMICLRGATCSGGADDDSDICRSGATCTEDASDDTLNCAGAETFCNAGNGLNTIRCTGRAVCVDGRGNSEAVCNGASVSLGRGDHEAEGRNCKWTMDDGDNVLDGTGTNRVTLKGRGTFVRTGGGTVVVDADNGEKNVIDCNGGKGIVYVDEEDDPRDCETVIGADVWVRPGLSSYGDDRFQGLFYVGNSGPADATNVRVRAQITLIGAELRSYRAQAVTSNRNRLTSHVVDTPEGAQLVIECEFPVIRKGASELVQFIGTPTRRAEPAFISVEVRADEPDHVPANNAASREQDAKTFVGGKP